MVAFGIKAPILEETSLMHMGSCICPRLNYSSLRDPKFPQGAFPIQTGKKQVTGADNQLSQANTRNWTG